MKKGPRYFLLDNMLTNAAYWVSGGSVVATLTSYYNIPLEISTMLTSLTATLTLLQMLGGVMYSRANNKTAFLRTICLLWRLFLPAVFFSVLLPMNIGAVVFCVSLVLMVTIFQLASPCMLAWTVDSVQGHVKGDYYAQREMIATTVFTIAFCVAGMIIDRAQRGSWQKEGFIWIGALEIILIAISIPFLCKLPHVSDTAVEEHQSKKHVSLWQQIKPILHNQDFMRVLYANTSWCFASMFLGSFVAVYQVRTLNMPFSTILIWATIANLMRSALTPVMQRLAQRTSWRFVTQGTLCMMLVYGIGWLFITPENMNVIYPLLSILGTVPYAGMGVGWLQLQVANLEEKERTLYFSFIATMNGMASLIGSLLCSTLIALLSQGVFGITDLRVVFGVGACTMLVSIGLMQCLKKNKVQI